MGCVIIVQPDLRSHEVALNGGDGDHGSLAEPVLQQLEELGSEGEGVAVEPAVMAIHQTVQALMTSRLVDLFDQQAASMCEGEFPSDVLRGPLMRFTQMLSLVGQRAPRRVEI